MSEYTKSHPLDASPQPDIQYAARYDMAVAPEPLVADWKKHLRPGHELGPDLYSLEPSTAGAVGLLVSGMAAERDLPVGAISGTLTGEGREDTGYLIMTAPKGSLAELDVVVKDVNSTLESLGSNTRLPVASS